MAEDINPDDLELADELIAERRTAAPSELPDDMPKIGRNIVGGIDTMNNWVGRIVALLLIPLCAAMVYEVIARKFGISSTLWWQALVRVFSNPDAPSLISPAPTLWAYDISRMLYGAMLMLGAGYALSRGVQIHADSLYRNWSDRTKGTVDLFLYTILFFPGMFFLFYFSFDYAVDAWMRNERGMDTAWMPAMGPIKTCIPVGVALLILQGISEWYKSAYTAKHGRWPV